LNSGLGNTDRRTTLVALLRPYRKSLVITLLAVVGAGIANLLQPWPLKVVFDILGGSKPIHGWLRHLVHAQFGSHKLAMIEFAALGVIAIAGLNAFCSYIESYTTTSIGQWVSHDLRSKLYNHIQQLSLIYLNRSQTGDLLSRLTTDIEAVQSFAVSGLVGLTTDAITLLGMVSVMFYLNWRFTLIALSVAPILFFITYSFTGRSKKASREVRKKQGQIVSLMEEDLSAIGVVKAFAREDYEQQRLDEQSREAINMALRARSLKAKLSPLVDIVVALGTALVLGIGGKLVLEGVLSAGSLIVFIWYLGKMYKPMQDFAKIADSYSKAAIGYERIREVLDTTPEVRDLPSARSAHRFTGEVAFEEVNFSYTPGQPVLTNVDFNVAAGELAALVGPTGAGKSTIAALIARLYDPDSGAIKIDGQDLRGFTQKSLRDQISFVLQENILFRATIWENIAYGKPEATREEILQAAKMADADEFIAKLPAGYDTVLGERGVTLSGGQRQRIAIARAVIRNTPILILDEPSSGLDAASEQMVFAALERLTKGKTTLVIAHRLATVQRADVIMVLNNGGIVESGKHEQLLRDGGLYSKLYEIQFSQRTPGLACEIA
jgi:ATP-binding cassette, subfamily B, bacterial